MKYTKPHHKPLLGNMQGPHPVLLTLAIVFLLFPVGHTVSAKNLPVIGWLENVQVSGTNFPITAKIDTGADNSSINANIKKKFKRDGQDWVEFEIKNNQGKKAVFKKKVIRYARIKRKLAPSIKRPVIELGLCIGRVYRLTRVNLSNRTKYKYQMLIGRNFLRNTYLVDSGMTLTTTPECKP